MNALPASARTRTGGPRWDSMSAATPWRVLRARGATDQHDPPVYTAVPGTGAAEVERSHLNRRHAVLVLTVLAAAVGVALAPRLPQPAAYHLFADQRAVLGIPNGLDVLSNLPFAIAGVWGLAVVVDGHDGRACAFAEPWLRWPYATVFLGSLLTGLGSAWYHLAPDNARLVWDRLPMSIGFMGLVTAQLAERASPRFARQLFLPLLLLGAGSVLYWYWSELQGAGDLRLYGFVQFGSLLVVVLLLLLYRARQSGTGYLVAALAAYTAAKAFEFADARIFAMVGVLSGHTLKHLAAAAGVVCLAAMLRVRQRGDS